MSEFTNIFEDGEVVGYNPDADGDYHKVTDYKRDFEYNQEQIARAIKALSSNPTEDFMILYGGVVTDSGSGQVDISAGVAIGQDAEGDARFIILPAQSNVPMPSGWDDGRQIWVVGRHDWKLGSSTRNHKQTATSYHYTVEDSYLGETDTDDLFVDADPTGSYVIWGSFTMTGTTFSDQDERSTEWDIVTGTITPRNSWSGTSHDGTLAISGGIRTSGYMHGSSQYESNIWGALTDPGRPLENEYSSRVITGSLYDGGVLYTLSRMIRSSSTTLVFYGIASGASTTITITQGSSNQIDAISIAW